MTAPIARLFAPEIALFACASLVHAGLLPFGEPHSRAATAEAIIAVILALGFATGLVRPSLARHAALVAQGLALLGTLVGAFTIAIGIGPQTGGDTIFHVVLVAVLVLGLWLAARSWQR